MSSKINRTLEIFSPFKGYVRNIAIVFSGSSFSELVPILISPLLTRVYSAEDFGKYGFVISLAALLNQLSTLSYENSIVISKNDHQVFTAWKACECLTIFINSVCLVLSLFVCLWFFGSASDNDFLWYALIPVISFSGAFLRIQILLANREERFKDVVHSRILSTLVTALSSIVCGLLLFKSNGLILSLILGNLSGAFFLRFYKTTTSYYNKKEFLKIFKRYKNFFYYSLPSDLMNIGTSRYPLLAFPLMMESEIIGYLALAYRVVCLPSRFVSNAVAEIFFQHARKEMETNKECRNLFLLTTGMLIVVGLVGFGSLFLLSDFLFELFFGPTWKLAGTYVKILIPLFLIIFIVSTLNSMIYVAEKQNLNLIWQTIYLAAILGSTVGSWFFYGGAETILLSFVIAASMAYGIYFWMLYGLARGKKDKLP